MTKYQDIDDSCDMSALLGIIINIDKFPVSVRTHSEKVRSSIRNPWAHCDFSEWDNGRFSTTFRELESLINSLTIKVSKKGTILDELRKWETNGPGTLICQCTPLGLELVNEIHKDTSVLAKYAKVLKCILETDMENKAAVEKVILDDLGNIKEKIKDITQYQEEIIPKRIRDDHMDEIRYWEKDNETFIDTRATEKLMSWLSTCNIAVVTGSSGTGKSFLIHHVALVLHRQKKLHVFNDPQFKKLTLFTENAFDLLSEPLRLLPEERILMIKKYLKTDKIDHVIDDLCHFDFFPLLCKMSENMSFEELPLFLTSPIDTIKRHIEYIIASKNKYQVCALVLSILFSDGFKEELLNCRPRESSDVLNKLNEITRQCDIDLSSGFARRSLKDGFSTLMGTYLKKIGPRYSIIHDKIHDIISTVCGQYLDECFIINANGRFIGDRFIFRSIETNSTEHFIILSEEMEELYFERLVRDLRQRYIYSTLHNKQLVHEPYRKKLIRYLNNSEEVQDLFIQIDKYGIKLELDKGHWLNDPENDEEVRNITFPLIAAALEGFADIVELLIKLNCNVNKKDNLGRSSLYKACEGGHEDIVELLLNHSADASSCDKMAFSPLHMACKTGNNNIVKMLLAKNVEVSKPSKSRITPLYLACAQGNTDTVELLLQEKADVHISDTWLQYCPLHVACKAGHVNAVKLLLNRNADVNRNSNFGETPLSLACMGGYDDIVRNLLEKKAEVNDTSTCESPLYLACKTGHLEIVNMLLAIHADKYPEKYQRDDDIYSPLAVACKRNRIDIIQLLQQKCSNKITLFDKFYSLGKASFYGCTDIVKYFMNNFSLCEKLDFSINEAVYSACKGGNLETVQYFLTQGLDIFHCSSAGRSLLHATCEAICENGGHINVINLLITNKLEISKPDEKGLSPLHLACENDLNLICKLLIRNKADVNMQDGEDRTPLHFACHRENLDTVEVLLEHKANTKLCNITGKTPLHVICERLNDSQYLLTNKSSMFMIEMSTKRKSIVKSLIDRNAEVNSRDREGETPLHKTCISGDYELAKILLSIKCEINLQNCKGQTPLYLACKYGAENVVTLLLEENADTNKADNEGITPLLVYNPRNHQILNSAKGFLPILHKSEKMKDLVDKSQLIGSRRQAPNLKKLLTRAQFSTQKEIEREQRENLDVRQIERQRDLAAKREVRKDENYRRTEAESKKSQRDNFDLRLIERQRELVAKREARKNEYFNKRELAA
ncbi:ankyrin repeat and KH domain-containing protein 1-like [Mytilus trossulus]|uniref:ankyrin repeat and KH domain-containing protein 1-like n=1 Tax=Mytilus trossulus TaxID=6551 RepID=UPI003005732F